MNEIIKGILLGVGVLFAVYFLARRENVLAKTVSFLILLVLFVISFVIVEDSKDDVEFERLFLGYTFLVTLAFLYGIKKAFNRKPKKYSEVSHVVFNHSDDKDSYTLQVSGTKWSSTNDVVYAKGSNSLYIDNFSIERGGNVHATDKQSFINLVQTCEIMYIIGQMGFGKTQFLNNIINQVLPNEGNADDNIVNAINGNYRAQRIFYNDFKGDFTRDYYVPNRDIIVSLFDERGQVWDIWEEAKTSIITIESFIKGVLDSRAGDDDNFFGSSALDIIFDAFVVAFEGEHETQIEKYEAWFEAINNTNVKNEDVMQNVQLALGTFQLMAWRASRPNAKTFTLEAWFKTKSQLFMLNKKKYADKQKPYFSGVTNAMLDILLSKDDLTNEEKPSHITLLVLDELFTLNVGVFKEALVTVRSKGGGVIIGTQKEHHDEEINSFINSSKAISVMFNVEDPKARATIETRFGDAKFKVMQLKKSHSYTDGKETTSLNKDTSHVDVKVLPQHLLSNMPKYYHITHIKETGLLYYATTPLSDRPSNGNSGFEEVDANEFFKFKRELLKRLEKKALDEKVAVVLGVDTSKKVELTDKQKDIIYITLKGVEDAEQDIFDETLSMINKTYNITINEAIEVMTEVGDKRRASASS